jgi:hypothetical protein
MTTPRSPPGARPEGESAGLLGDDLSPRSPYPRAVVQDNLDPAIVAQWADGVDRLAGQHEQIRGTPPPGQVRPVHKRQFGRLLP